MNDESEMRETERLGKGMEEGKVRGGDGVGRGMKGYGGGRGKEGRGEGREEGR